MLLWLKTMLSLSFYLYEYLCLGGEECLDTIHCFSIYVAGDA
jgi:hypothetical protein